MLKKSKNQALFILAVSWMVVNLIQAAFLGVDGDEAYYWTFSQELDWGFFDHPPFVAALIKLGESIGHGPIFTRLGTVILSTLTLWVMYKSLPERLREPRLFAFLFPSVLLFNVYGFIATPDAPLLFFSSVFFFAYRKYLEKEDFFSALLISISITGMFYSKYHGILPVALVTLSNLQLMKKKSFWLIIAVVTLSYTPHLYWQYTHDWPTLRFHLLERGIRIYKIGFTLDYILGQLLIWGPVISFLFYGNVLSIKKTDKLTKAHLFNFFGTLFIFLLSSFKNHVEAHWTLIAGTSFVFLFMDILSRATEKKKRYFLAMAKINIVLIALVRLIFLIPGSPLDKINNYKPFFHGKNWADSIHAIANNTPVVFSNSYMMPSLYRYYHPEQTGFGYNTKAYRKTQFSINQQEQKLANKKVFWFNDTATSQKPMIVSAFKSGDLVPVSKYTPLNPLKIVVKNLPEKIKTNDTLELELFIKHTGNDPLYFDGLIMSYAYAKYSYQVEEGHKKIKLKPGVFPPGFTGRLHFSILSPATKGKNRILFSLDNEIPGGNFASPYYTLTVE